MLDMFRNEYTPETLPYHLVVPSLPGYTFSSPPPLDKHLCIEDIARVFNKLGLQLGFGDGYVKGGDIGSKVAMVMTAEHDGCKGELFVMSLCCSSCFTNPYIVAAHS